MTQHIVIAVFGSLGDLHPMMALALGLQQRGYRVTLATHSAYRDKVVAEGIGFTALRPEMSLDDLEVFRRVMNRMTGSEYLVRKMIMPFIHEMYEDLSAVLATADLLINNPLIYAGPLAARKQNIPWVGVALAPFSFFSAYDPPVFPNATGMSNLRFLGRPLATGFNWLAQRSTQRWLEPYHDLRRSLNLPEQGNPIFEGQFSPILNLAMFSKHYALPQPDWPDNTVVTGFLFYDKRDNTEPETLTPELEAFLNAGDPPVVFTLGSAAVYVPGDFYAQSLQAVEKLGCRAVLLVGDTSINKIDIPSTERVFVQQYAPFSQLFPRAAAVVHQGGIGSTAQVMRAGKPMLVVPFAFDQLDNAERVRRLGIGLRLDRDRYTSRRAAEALQTLLTSEPIQSKAQDLATQIQSESGTTQACNWIEFVFTRRPQPSTGGAQASPP